MSKHLTSEGKQKHIRFVLVGCTETSDSIHTLQLNLLFLSYKDALRAVGSEGEVINPGSPYLACCRFEPGHRGPTTLYGLRKK